MWFTNNTQKNDALNILIDDGGKKTPVIANHNLDYKSPNVQHQVSSLTNQMKQPCQPSILKQFNDANTHSNLLIKNV